MIRGTYKPEIIFLSFAIAYLGSYLAITICEQYRQCRIDLVDSRHIPVHGYLIVMAICLGGVGIWCMHFIGMFAVTAHDGSGKRVHIRFDIGFTILSMVLAVVFTLLGFYISSLDVVFTKTKKQIVELFVEDAGGLSMKDIRHFTHFQMLLMMATHFPSKLLYGGICTGSGLVLAHYVGMTAMRFPGEIVWDTGLIAASIIVAILASTVAFWILFRLLVLYSNKENLRLACAFCMACAVSGMHYIGMVAARMEFHSEHSAPEAALGTTSATSAFAGALIFAASVSFLVLVLALSDMRYSVHRLGVELSHADEAMMTLPVISVSSCAAAAQRYLAKRRASKVCMSVLNQPNTYEHDLEAMAHAHEAQEDSTHSFTARLSRSISHSAFAQSLSNTFHLSSHAISKVPFSASGGSSPVHPHSFHSTHANSPSRHSSQPHSPVKPKKASRFRDIDGTMFIPRVIRRKPSSDSLPDNDSHEIQHMITPRAEVYSRDTSDVNAFNGSDKELTLFINTEV